MKRKIKCPICKKRALDAEDNSTGEISIKCPHCKNIVSIVLKFNKHHK